MKTILEEQIKLMTLAKSPKDIVLVQNAVKTIQEITINEMYNNLHKNDDEKLQKDLHNDYLEAQVTGN